MKKKIIAGIILCVLALALVVGIKIYQRENDPYWQIAEDLHNVESALQEIDESWELESLSQVTPYCYQNPEGTTITYYCCTTTYLNGEPTELAGLNKTALGQVVDVDALDDRRECEVNGKEAVMGEQDGLTYLCWTLSSTYSCVLEFTAGTVAEDDIFRIAGSVQVES